MQEERPNPNSILQEITRQEERQLRGRLKIFFGYAAGVGKTYAMLEAAHTAQIAGVDVLAGYIEPHERPETLALMSGLPVLEPRRIDWNGITVQEFDLDAAIKRRPELILVDEMAHTNAKGSRNLKRYQDIEELLRAGINVFTTVNVQHIESLHDMVYQITKVAVHERIPDKMIDEADKIELVDLEPEELLARLDDGKVYKNEQARRAMQNFFTRENLIALREIALRRTADQINKHLEQTHETSARGYYTSEHILICLSSSPSNKKVIRTAARMAGVFHASFTALFVQTPHTTELTGENRERLRENLKLAEQLGAKIATVYGENVPEQIAEYAKVAEVSKIVIGRSRNQRSLFAKPGFVDKLTQLAPNLDIHIIPDNQNTPYNPPKSQKKTNLTPITLRDTLVSLALMGVATGVGFGFYQLEFKEANIIMVYILGVLLTAVCTRGRIYSAVSSILSVLVFNYFFTVPRFTLNAYDSGYPVTFGVMLVAALLTSSLTMRVKEQARQNALKARRTETLLETSQKLQKAPDREAVFTVMGQQIGKLLERLVLVYPVIHEGMMEEPLCFPTLKLESTDAYLTPSERAVAQWVRTNNKNAGATTQTLSSARCFYLAVRGQTTVYAVVAIAMDREPEGVDAYEKSVLISMLGEFGLTLEKEAVWQANREVYLKAQQERLRANLLRAISHDLRTPLTSISGNANMLMENGVALRPEIRKRIYTDIYDDAMWLMNLVENLLCLTRIDNAQMQLSAQPELLDEIVTEALKHISRRSAEYDIVVDIPDDMLMATMDARLIMQVLINLCDNAFKYTPTGSRIVVRVYAIPNARVAVEVQDNGKGIPQTDQERIFDMFYTANNTTGDNRRGMGLGLSLCKSIIAAHGGEISVRDNHPKGTIFMFTLPAKEVQTDE